MTVLEAVLYLAVVPAAIYGLLVLIAMWPRFTRPRYRSGQEWDFAPVFWVANPLSVNTAVLAEDVDSAGAQAAARPSTARGGARGNW